MGAEGMNLEDGRHLLIADSMLAFAEALAVLAKDPARGLALADQAWAFQQDNYTPAAITSSFVQFLSDCTKPRHETRA